MVVHWGPKPISNYLPLYAPGKFPADYKFQGNPDLPTVRKYPGPYSGKGIVTLPCMRKDCGACIRSLSTLEFPSAGPLVGSGIGNLSFDIAR